MHVFYALWLEKKGTSWNEVTSNSKEIKLIALSIAWLEASFSQSA